MNFKVKISKVQQRTVVVDYTPSNGIIIKNVLVRVYIIRISLSSDEIYKKKNSRFILDI